jgi:hypothetical protein
LYDSELEDRTDAFAAYDGEPEWYEARYWRLLRPLRRGRTVVRKPTGGFRPRCLAVVTATVGALRNHTDFKPQLIALLPPSLAARGAAKGAGDINRQRRD